VIDGDDGQLGAVALNRDVDRGLVEGGIDVIDGDGIMWVGGVT
jgi:hypothetical protein